MSGTLKTDRQTEGAERLRLSVISFSETGAELAARTAEALAPMEVRVYGKYGGEPSGGVSSWAEARMKERDALLFIGAAGIAVRAIAPHIVSKLVDSPVLVMDELGLHVIPVLSGHVGGANALAVTVAEAVGAEPVITTATDLHGKFAVDVFAKENGLRIVNKDGIAKVSSRVLRGEPLRLCAEDGILPEEVLEQFEMRTGFPPAAPVDVLISRKDMPEMRAICLAPKRYVLGVGCRRGKDAESIERFISERLAEAGIGWDEIARMASIDLKADEEGLLALSRAHRIPFVTFSAEELNELEGDFQESAFVKATVGVGNVCERAALLAAGDGGRVILKKAGEDGVTCAVSERIKL